MKTCNEIDAIMTAYVDGEVDAPAAAAVRDHLAECPPCRERASVESTARQLPCPGFHHASNSEKLLFRFGPTS